MKLALSSLAFPPGDGGALWPALGALGVTALEIAPLQFWPESWMAPTAAQAAAAGAAAWAAGLPVIGLHNVLGGRAELHPLNGPEAQRAGLASAVRAAEICRDLGGRMISIDATQPVEMSERAALTLWRDFLLRLAEAVEDFEVLVSLTPQASTPTERGLSARDCYILSNAVDHPSLGLMLSAAALPAHNEMRHPTFAVLRGRLDHFRLDEPGLAEIGAADSSLDHADLRRHLAAHRYTHWVSVTQAHRPDCADPLAPVRRAAAFVQERYLVEDWR